MEAPSLEADFFDAPGTGGARPKPLLRDFLEVVVFALVLYFLIQAAVQTVHVVGISMRPTLADNDLLIAVKVNYLVQTPQRGDIVIFRPPAPADPERDYIKRVIGLPGERVHIVAGQVFINGHRLDEPYLPPAHNASFPLGGGDFVVPSGHYFVMGDNREHSSDSRIFCAITRDSIEGRAVIRIWPLDTFGLLMSGPVIEPAVSSPPLADGTCP